jgi:hypothetical protein
MRDSQRLAQRIPGILQRADEACWQLQADVDTAAMEIVNLRLDLLAVEAQRNRDEVSLASSSSGTSIGTTAAVASDRVFSHFCAKCRWIVRPSSAAEPLDVISPE